MMNVVMDKLTRRDFNEMSLKFQPIYLFSVMRTIRTFTMDFNAKRWKIQWCQLKTAENCNGLDSFTFELTKLPSALSIW